MAKVVITLTDTDQEKGAYRVDLEVADSKVDDGFVTAAHVTGLFIVRSVNTQEFSQGCISYGKGLNLALRHDEPVSAVITFEDVDLDAGQFEAKMEIASGPVTEDNASAAQLAASFIMAVMQTDQFRAGCNMFADSLLGDREGTVNQPSIESKEAA